MEDKEERKKRLHKVSLARWFTKKKKSTEKTPQRGQNHQPSELTDGDARVFRL